MKEQVKAGIIRSKSYARAGFVKIGESSRPTFTIMNLATITVVLPKWWNKLIVAKKLSTHEVEYEFRVLKEKLEEMDLVLVSYSLYEEGAYIKVKSIFDGSPEDAKMGLKGQLRLFNLALRNMKQEFKHKVGLLKDYRIINGNIRYCPVGPRKGPRSS